MAPITRRELVKRAGAGIGGIAVSGVAAQPIWARPKGARAEAADTIKIGYVSPLTGPAAGFGEGDPWILGLARKATANGLTIGGKHYAVQIVNKDAQSSPARSAQVTNDLVHGEKVDILLATSTPEVTNPASDAAEAAGVPNVSTVVPWEAWYFGRGAKPGKPSPFRYGYIFCFGTEDFATAYTHLWPQVKTNKKVGVMWPNDADGNAIRANLGPLLEKAGYTIVDPGGYQDGTNDYSSQIAKFKAAGVQIFNTFPIPPDFVTFWRQASQQGLVHQIRIAQIAKTGLFPSQVQAVGKLGAGLASGAYWTPHFPYRSSLTGLSSKAIGDGYTKASGKQWNQQLGSSMALLDTGIAALKASGDPKDKGKVAAAIAKLKVETPNGIVHWGPGGKKNPFPNVVAMPIIGGQWVKAAGKFPLDFVLCEHSGDPRVKIQAHLKPYKA